VTYKNSDLYPSGKRELLFILAGCIVAVVSLWIDLSSIEQSIWFQRSGSILVILGAICESKYIAKIISEDQTAMGDSITTKQVVIMHSGFIMALIGTAIWGYGDLLVKM
jgi:hypothetical protein